MPQSSANQHPTDCACCARPNLAAQSLEELDFLRSACNFAQTGNHSKLESFIAAHPASVNDDGCGGQSGFTPLHYAARAGHLDCAKLLLQNGCDINKQTRAGGATALHRAAYMGHLDVTHLLLSSGADVVLQDADGMTPLHKAASRGHAAVCEALLRHSPEAASLVSTKGQTFEDLTSRSG
mmetsp:Transcript_14000/g.42272  ORF Transcript_14000/g.42272 Transcript_14000/m.42272 type:complete len:181 (+) Transcript_14000:154-696(+)